MITGLGGSTIWSEDINRLLPFYRDTLGLKPQITTPEFVVLGPENAPALALGTHSEVKGKNADPARHMVGLMTNDIQADFRELKSKGVEFIEEPNDQGGLWIATLKDPDGNYVQLFQFVAQP